MTYFEEQYLKIKFPKVSEEGEIGFRKAQLGAIHSIARHFSLYDTEPALVVMPTGSGKTAVLALSPYLLNVKRVLILSSSKLVRGQITEEIKNLKTLIKINAFPDDIPLPSIKEIESELSTIENWNELKDYNFTIGIPKSLTSSFKQGVFPPTDLYDLILIDESHHLPAKSWTALSDHFVNSKKIYFTATPFRRDKKEIKGKLIFSYPLSKAYEDKIFGKVGYIPIKTEGLEKSEKDLLIAKKAEEVFKKDRQDGFEHFLMVRTKHKKHANDLKKLYDDNTDLNLRLIHSDHTYSYIKSSIKKLSDKELDGIICVNMLAEGFDFPSLKIGAIHEHHKSLAVTLQFIGRFARTNAPNLGPAKFIAAENDIVLGRKHLIYQDGAIWSDLIVNLSEEAIQEIEDNQEFVKQFVDKVEDKSIDKVDLSLSVLKPYAHIKIFRIGDIDINSELDIANQRIIFNQVDPENNVSVFITVDENKPKWIIGDELKDQKYFLYIIYYSKANDLLFIHFSGKKTNILYEEILECFGVEEYDLIPKSDIHKALYGLRDMTFFNIGLQSRAVQSGESYRIISGSAAHNRLTDSTGRMYSNGHIQGSGVNAEGVSTTIGYSSGSKVWSSEYINVKDFVKFSNLIGGKINSKVVVKTNTSIDNIPIPIEIKKIPDGEQPTFGLFHDTTYKDNPLTKFSVDGTDVYNKRLTDVDIEIDYTHKSDDEVKFFLKGEGFEIPVEFSIKDGYKYLIDNEISFLIHYGDDTYIELLKYLTDYPITFQLTDLSTIANGNELLIRSQKAVFNSERLEEIDWDSYKTDISKEYKNQEKGKRHVHDVLCEIISNSKPTVLIYDHGSHEIADFVVFRESDRIINVEIHHVKAADNQKTGDRVSYLYEVCGQAEKSLIWTKSINVLKDKINDRSLKKDNEVKLLGTDNKIKIGSKADLDRMLASGKQFKFEIFAVQPGLSKSNISEKLSHLLASTDDYIISNANNEYLRVLCSK